MNQEFIKVGNLKQRRLKKKSRIKFEKMVAKDLRKSITPAHSQLLGCSKDLVSEQFFRGSLWTSQNAVSQLEEFGLRHSKLVRKGFETAWGDLVKEIKNIPEKLFKPLKNDQSSGLGSNKQNQLKFEDFYKGYEISFSSKSSSFSAASTISNSSGPFLY